MILWTIKLLSTAKKAIAGRKYPHQLAWATAFGLLLGIVPHGNLLAVGLVFLVLSLNINHAMVALTAVATTFLVASRLDPISHLVGEFILTHPDVQPIAISLWEMPLVPWTDLNNTVVLGSSLIGIGGLVPVFVLSYPLFRLVAPKADANNTDAITDTDEFLESKSTPRPNDAHDRPAETEAGVDSVHQVVMVDRGHQQVAAPHSIESVEFEEVPSESLDQDDSSQVAVETRIDVIRMKGERTDRSTGAPMDPNSAATDTTDEQPMDEALNYLLRQLRDSQQRSAA